MEITWYQVNPPADDPAPTAPDWARTAGVADDGTIFVPAVASGRSEMEVMLCANYDGVPCAIGENHIYAPADWLKREWPKAAETIDLIVAKIGPAHQQTSF